MRKNKLLTMFVASAIVLSSLMSMVSCRSPKSSESVGSSETNSFPNPVSTVDDVETHKVDGTLHDVNVNYEAPVGELIGGGEAQYVIVAPSEYYAAAKFMANHLGAATGAVFGAVVSDTCDLSSGKIIALGTDNIKNTITVPSQEELGNQGYYIKTVSDDVLIYCSSANGAQLAAIAFLRAAVGYDMFSEDCVVYERTDGKLPAMEIKERPDYEFRINSNTISDTAKYGMGFSMNGGLLTTDLGNVHNLWDFFSLSDLENHKKWFSDNAAMTDDEGNKVRIGQPCFTAHGDKEEYNALIDHFANKVISILKEKPTVANIRISQNDTVAENVTRKCNCVACTASYDFYGTLGGAMLSFTNDVAEKVNAYIDENEPNREFKLIVLAYGESVQAPVQRENGSYVLDSKGKGIPEIRYEFNENGEKTAVTDEEGNPVKLVCERGVGYEFAASAANWIHSFYEEENREYASAVEAWAGLGASNLHIWSYEISYYQYLYPYNNYQIMLDNFKYFKEFGGYYIYPEGTWENRNNPGFAKLRDYINSKGMFDVNVDYNELVDKFFKYYFREAAPIMRAYFNEVQVVLSDNERITGGGVHSYALSDSRVWQEGLITNWNNSFKKAEEAIEKYSGTDDDLYEALKKHILIESLFPRYVLCTTYARSYSASQRKEMRKAFIEDFEKLGNTTHQEHFKISAITSTWDLT